jgi:hypothetical protein
LFWRRYPRTTLLCSRPLLGDLPHAAALWGTGSDVLGYDTAQSTDHGWGPRMQVFVAAADVARAQAALADLPETFRGWPVRYGWDAVPVQSHVRVSTLADWLRGHLGLDPRTGMTALDWLLIPQQILLEVIGPVLADPDGELRHVQGLLAAFPPQVRLWMGRGELLSEPTVTAIAEAHGVTPAQAILRWHVQLGAVPIPKSPIRRGSGRTSTSSASRSPTRRWPR